MSDINAISTSQQDMIKESLSTNGNVDFKKLQDQIRVVYTQLENNSSLS
jgi:hypothetical protein